MNEFKFIKVWETEKLSLLSSGAREKKMEKLFIPASQKVLYDKMHKNKDEGAGKYIQLEFSF